MTRTICAAFVGAIFLLTSAAQAAILVDLTTRGSSGTINGALYQQFDAQPTGTGVLNTFLRVQKQGVEQGYNTDWRPTGLDEKVDLHTRSLLLSETPKVTISDITYREFLLDINEAANEPLLSLNEVQIFLAATGNVHNRSNLGAPLYDMDAGTDANVKLNYSLNHGSGSGDMLLYVPDSLFNGNAEPYVYLYSRFGEPIPGDNSDVSNTSEAGFEEWAAGKKGPNGTIVPVTPPPVPEPGSIALLLICATAMLRRRGR
ncbi:MAG TPA: PEP-CTERM sorting domain-containing protein [Tepidisphaeraceae bacterium]|jgi:hypothetical protein|nr:PEP-CTERM sorting domain-containing protein [Tepidisphaeraceae bacterium]